MTTEIFGSRGSAGTPAESLDDKARRAVSNFRSLQPTLTTYARILTGKRDVRVVAAATDNGSTNGEIINFRPPLALGDTTLHVRRYCDKRDEDGIHLCEACRIREEVLVTIYHEIAHICFESFQPTTEQDKLTAIKFAVREAKGKWAEQIAKRIESAPTYKTRDYINLVSLINEYLPFLLNALEDARVNRELFKARPGVKRMFDADTEKIFREGFEARKPDGSFTTAKWDEAPLNNQIMIGCFCKASGYDYHNWFHPDVVRDLDDEELTNLINQMDTVRSAQSVYNLSFKVLARLRELGYCGTPQDPDPEPEPEPEADAEPESDESESNESDKEGSPDSDDLPSESGSSGESDERDGESDADNDAASEEGEEGESQSEDDQPSGSSEGDSDDSDSSPGDEESDGTGDDSEDSEESDGSGNAEGEDSGESDGEQSSGASSGMEGDLGDADDSTDESSSDSKPNRGGEVDEDSEGQAEDSSSPDSSSECGDGRSSGDDSQPRGMDEEDHLDESESAGNEGDLGDADLGGSQGLDSGTNGSREAGEEDDSSEQSGMEASHEDASVPESEEDGDALDSGADDGYGGTQTDQESKPEFGTIDDLTGVLEIWGDHEEKPKSTFEQNKEKIENDAVDKAVIQGIYFTRPSQNITGVREHFYGKPVIIDGRNYSEAWRGSGNLRRTGAIADLDLPETLIQPALLKMRRAFTDNQRGSHLKNRRSGRVNSSALGKRAWSGDDRLFQKNKLPGKKNYFVVIGMDISGSTVGKNLALEKRAIMAQATMLDRVGIPFAIYAHTGNHHSVYTGHGFDLEIYHIKDPNEPWTDKEKERLEDIKSSSANIDGHALEYLRKVCDGRTETDRIIMYYSDGKMPAENYKEELEILTSEIQTCRTKGYTLLGVGIRTDSPRQHGLDTVEVWKDEDLLKVITHLEKRLSETNRR